MLYTVKKMQGIPLVSAGKRLTRHRRYRFIPDSS